MVSASIPGAEASIEDVSAGKQPDVNAKSDLLKSLCNQIDSLVYTFESSANVKLYEPGFLKMLKGTKSSYESKRATLSL